MRVIKGTHLNCDMCDQRQAQLIELVVDFEPVAEVCIACLREAVETLQDAIIPPP